MTQTTDLYSMVLGGLMGQAFGDAFAMPAAMRPEDTWKRYNGWLETFHPGLDDHPAHHGLHAGRITDDTEQAFALAESFIEDQGVTVDGVARAIVRWYERVGGDESSYVGPSTRRACQALRAGADPRKTGIHGDTDGGAMRVSPVGLINPGNIDRAIADTVTACMPTHFTDVAISGAAAVAAAIAAAMVPGSSMDDIIAAAKYGAVEGRSHGEVWLGASINRRIDLAIDIARRDTSEYDRIVDMFDLVGSTLMTSETVPSAFGMLVMSDGDLMRCAQYSAAISGDADTVAAIACAIAGAWKGIRAFPADVIRTLESANPEYDFRNVAQGLTKIAQERSA